MEKNFSTNQLIRYLYQETSPVQNEDIEKELSQSWELKETFQALKAAYETLPKVSFYPKKTTLQFILRYSSEQTALEPHL